MFRLIFTSVVLFSVITSCSFAKRTMDVTVITFGSCNKESRPAPVFEAITKLQPDAFIWMGDIIYADTLDMAVMKQKYDVLKAKPQYQALCRSTTVIGTWDDHDYGDNDVGGEYPKKKESQQLFLDFMDAPSDDPRRTQEGIYTSHTLGEGDRSVKIILLDTRYFREQPSRSADILGREQWRWLEEELVNSKAAINIIVSSTQVLASEHRWEKWADYPESERKLYRLLKRSDVPPVVLFSGDRHLAEIMVDEEHTGYPLYEISSSSLNFSFGGLPKEENSRRIGENFGQNNFGMLTIDWDRGPILTALICNEQGVPVRSTTFQLEK